MSSPKPNYMTSKFSIALALAIATMLLTRTLSADDAAFKKLLVESSPWSVKWENFSYSGTFKMSFVVADDSKLNGKLFDQSGGHPDKGLKKIVTRKNQCVSFSSETGTKYDLCLEASGSLKGDQDHTTQSGDTLMGTVVALPAKR